MTTSEIGTSNKVKTHEKMGYREAEEGYNTFITRKLKMKVTKEYPTTVQRSRLSLRRHLLTGITTRNVPQRPPVDVKRNS